MVWGDRPRPRYAPAMLGYGVHLRLTITAFA